MNLNEQLQQAYNAGRRQGLSEQMDMMPGTPYAAPMPGDPPIAPGTPPGGDNEIDFRKPILKYVYELEKRLGLPPGTLSNPAGTWPGPGYDGDD